MLTNIIPITTENSKASPNGAVKKRALIAIARKMMAAACHILLTGELFNPKDLELHPTPVRAE